VLTFIYIIILKAFLTRYKVLAAKQLLSDPCTPSLLLSYELTASNQLSYASSGIFSHRTSISSFKTRKITFTPPYHTILFHTTCVSLFNIHKLFTLKPLMVYKWRGAFSVYFTIFTLLIFYVYTVSWNKKGEWNKNGMFRSR
jgi:hypothetical protein